MTTPNLDQFLSEAAPLIDARVAITGRPREIYEAYLTREPRPGQTWEDALFDRLDSLAAGPAPERMLQQIRRMVPQVAARTTEAA